uniref:Uncharacterized protein n=1 Tax=Romanomermis culicivorax TaxID=13658 RepID=A0A915IV36_ROMCU
VVAVTLLFPFFLSTLQQSVTLNEKAADAIQYNKIICKFDGGGHKARTKRMQVGEPKSEPKTNETGP